jgi:hypothetical protein
MSLYTLVRRCISLTMFCETAGIGDMWPAIRPQCRETKRPPPIGGGLCAFGLAVFSQQSESLWQGHVIGDDQYRATSNGGITTIEPEEIGREVVVIILGEAQPELCIALLADPRIGRASEIDGVPAASQGVIRDRHRCILARSGPKICQFHGRYAEIALLDVDYDIAEHREWVHANG